MKIVKVPLTDIYDRDFITWEVVKNNKFDDMKETLEWKVNNRVRKKKLTARVDGKVYIEWLGYVLL